MGEDEHEGEGPVRRLGIELGLIGRGGVAGDVATEVAGGGGGDVGAGCTGEEVIFFS